VFAEDQRADRIPGRLPTRQAAARPLAPLLPATRGAASEVGNPVRAWNSSVWATPAERFGERGGQGRLRILVVGGSLGAQAHQPGGRRRRWR
jgi:UDP-N-acetylglucosamine:LPS N-acetylglucosamine transferase